MIRVCAGSRVACLLVLMSLSGSSGFTASGFFIAAFPLISNCSALWKSEKVTQAGTLSARTLGAKRPLCPGGPQGSAQHQFNAIPRLSNF